MIVCGRGGERGRVRFCFFVGGLFLGEIRFGKWSFAILLFVGFAKECLDSFVGLCGDGREIHFLMFCVSSGKGSTWSCSSL